MSSYTTDTFFDGKIQVMQSRAGYRFSIDAVLLAFHAGPRSGDKILDLGTGCGIISMIMAVRAPDIRIFAIEVQPELAGLAKANVNQNQLEDRIEVMLTDMKLLKPEMTDGPADLIVCNPPYRKPGSGRINPAQQRAVARHEIKVTLNDILETARRMLRTAGRFVTIYTAERATDVLLRMRSERIEPKFMRMIHSSQKADAKLVLIEGVKDGRAGLIVAPPLIIYDDNGAYTKEVKAMFEP
ncbi:MAG: tRNA1(Val) (adenine(37)-N6)-methyltransferase [Desulfobacterales bacterium]|nr:MAG: tRNA1(Val) (adenine(37)-N6)-methyltransferase [Desulfobacterales bacterium]